MRHLPPAQTSARRTVPGAARVALRRAGIALSFPERLARENGWSPDEGRRVCEEYKRFVRWFSGGSGKGGGCAGGSGCSGCGGGCGR